jgi:hypothetical protein
MLSVVRAQPAARRGSHEERAERDHRGDRRQALRARERKAEEHDVAGHVRDEHVAELQVARGVDEAGDERQRDDIGISGP